MDHVFEVLVRLKSDIAVIIFIKAHKYPAGSDSSHLLHTSQSEDVLFESGENGVVGYFSSLPHHPVIPCILLSRSSTMR